MSLPFPVPMPARPRTPLSVWSHDSRRISAEAAAKIEAIKRAHNAPKPTKPHTSHNNTVNFLSPGKEDPRVKQDLNLPPVPGLDRATYNDAAREAWIHDRGHHISMTEAQRHRLRVLQDRFPWLSSDYRGEVILGRAFQGRISPEDLLCLLDPNSPLAISIPRSEYYWGSKNGHTAFHKVELPHNVMNDAIVNASTDPAAFIDAWNKFVECRAWSCKDTPELAFNVLAAGNWHLSYILELARDRSWPVALEYHLLVHRKRMGVDRTFDPQKWYKIVDSEALSEAVRRRWTVSWGPTAYTR